MIRDDATDAGAREFRMRRGSTLPHLARRSQRTDTVILSGQQDQRSPLPHCLASQLSATQILLDASDHGLSIIVLVIDDKASRRSVEVLTTDKRSGAQLVHHGVQPPDSGAARKSNNWPVRSLSRRTRHGSGNVSSLKSSAAQHLGEHLCLADLGLLRRSEQGQSPDLRERAQVRQRF